jgi:hypothetical protein
MSETSRAEHLGAAVIITFIIAVVIIISSSVTTITTYLIFLPVPAQNSMPSVDLILHSAS